MNLFNGVSIMLTALINLRSLGIKKRENFSGREVLIHEVTSFIPIDQPLGTGCFETTIFSSYVKHTLVLFKPPN